MILTAGQLKWNLKSVLKKVSKTVNQSTGRWLNFSLSMSQSVSKLNSQSINETVSQQQKSSAIVNWSVSGSVSQWNKSAGQSVKQSLWTDSQCHSYYLLKYVNQSVN